MLFKVTLSCNTKLLALETKVRFLDSRAIPAFTVLAELVPKVRLFFAIAVKPVAFATLASTVRLSAPNFAPEAPEIRPAPADPEKV